MTARLIVKQGPVPNQQIELQEQLMNIGRSADNEIVINDAEVSRRHARILYRSGPTGPQFLLEDLGSTNGSFVNNLRCNTLTPLSDGDVIELGDSIQLIFLVGDGNDAPVDESDFDTADLPAMPVTPPPQPAAVQPAAQAQGSDQSAAPWWSSRRILIGCGCATLLLICLCGVTLFALDAYQGGQLLYCGGLRPFFEIVLGPFGFSPPCP